MQSRGTESGSSRDRTLAILLICAWPSPARFESSYPPGMSALGSLCLVSPFQYCLGLLPPVLSFASFVTTLEKNWRRRGWTQAWCNTHKQWESSEMVGGWKSVSEEREVSISDLRSGPLEVHGPRCTRRPWPIRRCQWLLSCSFRLVRDEMRIMWSWRRVEREARIRRTPFCQSEDREKISLYVIQSRIARKFSLCVIQYPSRFDSYVDRFLFWVWETRGNTTTLKYITKIFVSLGSLNLLNLLDLWIFFVKKISSSMMCVYRILKTSSLILRLASFKIWDDCLSPHTSVIS